MSIKNKARHRESHQAFLDMLDAAALTQVVKEPTRENNTLDLFITNNDTLITRCSTIAGLSDHDAVVVESRLRPQKRPQPKRQIPLWRKADWGSIRSHLESAWGKLTEQEKDANSADTLWTWFKATMEEAIVKYVPHRQAKKKEQHPWISRALKRLMKKEKKLFSRKKHQPTRNNISRHKKVQSQVQKKFRQEYWSYINGVIFPASQENTDPQDNKKTLWNYIKHCKKDSIGVASLRNRETGEMCTEPTAKAELLNKQLQSLF